MSIIMNNNPENVMKNLESYGKETGFTFPDGYYDDLYQKMMGKVSVEKHKITHRKQLIRFSIVSGAAATIALFITLNIIFKSDDIQPLINSEAFVTKMEDKVNPNNISAPTITENNSHNVNSQEVKKTEKRSQSTSKSNKSASIAAKYDKMTDETTVFSVVEFYEDDARSDEFQETLMDLECYYDF